MWIVASMPFWFFGVFLFLIGVYGIGKVAFTEGQVLKTLSDERLMAVCMTFIAIGGVVMVMAAKIAS